MDAGRLNRRIAIMRATLAADAYNELVPTWAVHASVKAKAVPIMDAERERAGETLAAKAYRFTIRYSSGVANVDPRDRITFDGRTYDISGVKEAGNRPREYLEITAVARAETP